jgi:hypothetical protein
MPGSWVEIANSALTKLGAPPIADFDEDTRAASLMSERQEPCRYFVLSQHPWNCAISRAQLAPDVGVPAFGFDAAFTLPADCLRPLRPENIDSWGRYTVEGGKILANTDILNLRYVAKVTVPTVVPEYLAETIAWYLASDTAYALTQDEDVRRMCANTYAEALKKAKFLDSSENLNQRLSARHFLSVRLG